MKDVYLKPLHLVLRGAAKLIAKDPITCERAIRRATPWENEFQHHRHSVAALCKFSDCYWMFDQLAPSWFGYPGNREARNHRILALLFAAEIAKDEA